MMELKFCTFLGHIEIFPFHLNPMIGMALGKPRRPNRIILMISNLNKITCKCVYV